ncbi:MAG: DUF1439 domain-containing protein [Deltaproteobacteria bacterium]|nr:DUF1439 domain-containing protein [Deltaproteobacteria bacterium]MBN2674003.1 DUF1439 domain-containing protein [Deltaproteobacteria bacterium]
MKTTATITKIGMAVLLVGWALQTASCSSPEVDVVISQQELQQKVAARFPLEKNVMIANVSLHSPEVYLPAGQVGMKLKFTAQLLKFSLSGSLDGRGTVRYDADSAQFFISDFELVSIDVAEKSFSNLDQLKSIILPMITSYLNETPVYTVTDTTVKGKITGKLLKRVEVKDNALVVTLGP